MGNKKINMGLARKNNKADGLFLMDKNGTILWRSENK